MDWWRLALKASQIASRLSLETPISEAPSQLSYFQTVLKWERASEIEPRICPISSSRIECIVCVYIYYCDLSIDG